MKEVILQRIQSNGIPLRAVFLPLQGMNLASLKYGDVEYIDQSTKNLFDEKFGGLGPLIGPHFYHRHSIPQIPDETAFPHIAKIQASGSDEPFSHGIGRYVAWNWSASDTTINANLSGMDTHCGVTLAALEGFDFKMEFKAHLSQNGIEINYNVESDTSPSIAGLHYYYALENREGIVSMSVEDNYNDMGVWKPIPAMWRNKETNELAFDLKYESDFGFRPKTRDFSGNATLVTGNRKLNIQYETNSDENAFQLYHPEGASFVCIEPVTAKNPRDAKQKKNHLKVRISFL